MACMTSVQSCRTAGALRDWSSAAAPHSSWAGITPTTLHLQHWSKRPPGNIRPVSLRWSMTTGKASGGRRSEGSSSASQWQMILRRSSLEDLGLSVRTNRASWISQISGGDLDTPADCKAISWSNTDQTRKVRHIRVIIGMIICTCRGHVAQAWGATALRLA